MRQSFVAEDVFMATRDKKIVFFKTKFRFSRFFPFVFLISLCLNLSVYIWRMWSQLLVGQTGKVADSLYSEYLGDTRYARTHAQDTAHTQTRQSRRRRCSSTGRGAASPPFCILLRVPNWGGGNRAGHVIHGSRLWTDRFATAALKSLNWMNIEFKICVFSAAK